MKHTLLSAITVISAVASAYASPLTPEQALARVSSRSPRGVKSMALAGPKLLYTVSDKADMAQMYVFSGASGDGFMILSADDAAVPVLGYSDTGNFDPANMPSQLKWWMSGYQQEINLLRSTDVKASSGQVPDLPEMEEVAPLLKSKWNQGEPYNKYCFTLAADGSSSQSVTGCVATAMAQAMYYFKEPAVGQGEISYKHGDSGTYTMNFASQAFDWTKMLPTYYAGTYSAEEADAVAYLMKACGYSVKMDYGKGESGASGANIPRALIDYFGYKGGLRLETRKFWTYSDWAQMIHENLVSIGPVIYDGDALDGGHSFVCDGYDGNGYFHFNWGWGGMADGYYLLDALNPDEYGIGGAAGGYNLGQQIILGITPSDTDIFPTHIMQFGNASGKIDGSILSLDIEDHSGDDFQYINPQEITVTFGLMVENTTDTSQPTQYFEAEKKNITVSQSDSYAWSEVGRSVNLDNVEMTEGDRYDFIMATLITTASGTQWVATVPMVGYSNRVSVIKTDGKYEITNYDVPDLEVSDFKVVSSPVYLNMPVVFEATFTNNTSTELTRNYSGEFFNSSGTKCYTMENFSITVSPGATETVQWTSVDWYKAKDADTSDTAGEYTLRLYDNWQGKYVDVQDQTVDVEPTPDTPEATGVLTVTDGTLKGDVYEIEGNVLKVSIEVTVEKGLFNKPILLEFQAPDSDGKYFSIQHKRFDAVPYLTEGQSATYSLSMPVLDVSSDTVYRIEATGDGLKEEKPLLVKFLTDVETGTALISDEAGQYTVYNLQGCLVLKADDPALLHSLSPGIYIVNGTKTVIR